MEHDRPQLRSVKTRNLEVGHSLDLPPPKRFSMSPVEEVAAPHRSASDKPEVVTAASQNGEVILRISFRGRIRTIRAKSPNTRVELLKVFSDDLVDVILGEREVPSDEREEVLRRISQEFKAGQSRSRVGSKAVVSAVTKYGHSKRPVVHQSGS